MAATIIPPTTGYRAGIKADDVLLSYGIESVWGTPATTGQALRITGDSLTSGEQTKRTGEFDGSRSAPTLFRTSFQAGGSINGLFSCGTLDDLLACCLCNTWGGSTLTDGGTLSLTKPTFLTIEKNLGGLQWLQYPGSFVTKMAFSMRTQSEITYTADISSKTENQLAAEPFISIAPISINPVLKFGANLSSKTFAGAAVPSFVDQIDLTIENTGAARQFGDGTFGAIGMDIGMLTVSGSFRAYFNTPALYASYVAQTAAPLIFNVNDDAGVNGYTFNICAAKLTSPSQPITGRGSDFMQTFTFQGQKDINGNTLAITRGAGPGGVRGSFSYSAT